jgi:hypothetical protein
LIQMREYHDAVVVVLQLSFQAVAALEENRLDDFSHWRTLEAHVVGRGMP